MLARVRTALPIHPTTGVRALGFTSRGPVWPVRGGSVDAGAAAPAAASAPAPAGDPAPAPAPAPSPAPAATPPAATPAAAPAGENLPDDPAALQQMILDLRRENASTRTNAKQTAADEARQELAQTVGKALGLVQDDQPVDPAELAKTVATTTERANAAEVKLAVFLGAGAHQGDPLALLDSASFLAKVRDLDPTSTDFAAKVDAAIKDAVTSNPKLKTVQVAGASGADHAGGSGEQRTRTPMSLDQAARAHYGTG